jgi:hypothetical protein
MIQPVPKSKKERKKEHIQTGQPSNITTASYYRVSKVVRSTG